MNPNSAFEIISQMNKIFTMNMATVIVCFPNGWMDPEYYSLIFGLFSLKQMWFSNLNMYVSIKR